MKICIFGAASDSIDKSYITALEVFAQKLAEQGHSLVYGAGKTGMMGAAARGMHKGGATVHGVVPEFFREHELEVIYTDCDKLTYTPTMATRKTLMEDEADAFLITPGGIGTFEEAFEVLTLKQLGRHKKPIVFYNINGYYDGLEAFMLHGINQGFMTEHTHDLYRMYAKEEDILNYLATYTPPEKSFFDYKLGGKK